VREQTIEAFLTDLAARIPAPGGGATAALHAAQAAALLAMVARYSDGPKYAADASEISSVREDADQLRESCTHLMAAAAAAFEAVTAAYRLPRDTPELAGERSAAIAAAMGGAAEPPAAVVAAAGRLLKMAEVLLPIGNRNVVSDVAAAAEAIRAAAATARISIEINLRGITDTAARARFADSVEAADQLEARAAQLSGAIRAELTG
jgi:methenyltetrahydrofolate cyclohydrolase